MSYTEDHKNIRQYLLGNLSEEIRQRVEERLITEDSFFEELLLGEEELIDDYVSGELTDDDRLKFEEHFLSTPERHEKLRFALALGIYGSRALATADSRAAKAVSSAPATEWTWAERLYAFWNSLNPVLRASAALLAVAIIAGALWFSLLRSSPPRTFQALTLTVNNNTRGAEGVQAGKVTLPLSAEALRISLTLPVESKQAVRYRVELENVNGESKPLEIAGQNEGSVSVVIPAEQLARGRYALKLFMTKGDGTEQRISGSYFFTVE